VTVKGCGCPRKKVFRSELDAKIALANIWRKDRPTARERRAYRCPNKPWLWHLTSYEGRGSGMR
jgi:hypothetical protein